MAVIVTLPEGFEYVGGGLLSTAFLILGQSFLVSKYRKRAGIPYPQLYAEKSEAEASKDAYLFNCAQRAHQNTLENINTVYLNDIERDTLSHLCRDVVRFVDFVSHFLYSWICSRRPKEARDPSLYAWDDQYPR
ncbi:hypothetical protein D9613_002169 [Agrocybe pediades]|uniref:Uncharacterized protein n=1 Tax=Agrocybe pediades TaxID=84607 RepID=A0A8H4R6E5_9AGAR|nr:hypothetical protein D9613_002169 [Agrocybe pediades]